MRKLYLILSIFIFCLHNNALAGERIIQGHISFKTVTNAEPQPLADFKTLVVPIKRAGNLIIIEAQVDSVQGNFILDTGAPGLVLNETYFRDFPRIEEQEVGGVNGTATGSFSTYVRNFKILDLQYKRLNAQVTDLSFLENSRHIKILGLLGTRLFSKFAITIDLFKNVLYIQKVDKEGDIPEQERIFHDRLMVSPFQYLNNVIFLKGSVSGYKFWFAFDSAAETSLLDYESSKKVLPDMQIIGRSKLSGVGGSDFEVIYVRFDQLSIGGKFFDKNKALLTSLKKMERTYGHSVDGILGYDFFDRGIFTINFVKKEFEMYIYTN